MKPAAGLLLVLAGAANAAGLAEAGRQIYAEGRSARDAPISASLGRDSLPATLLPCIQCHGADGRGRSEGGVRPADIRPAVLARELRDERRQRPAYDAARLSRAITLGLDAGGQPLDTAMPRYALSLADAEELLAYLASLDQQPVPGVSAQRIRIALGGDIALAAPAGEIYGRRIELVAGRDDVLLAIDTSADGAASLAESTRDGLPTLVFAAGDAPAGTSGFSVLAADALPRRLAQHWAEANGGQLLDAGCIAEPSATVLALTDRAAAHCDAAALQALTGRRVRVFLAAPPDPALRARVMQAVLDLVAEQLRRLGRDLTREKVQRALQSVQTSVLAGLPGLRWTRDRHHGLQSVWVMQLDHDSQRWLAQPGWVDAGEVAD